MEILHDADDPDGPASTVSYLLFNNFLRHGLAQSFNRGPIQDHRVIRIIV